MRALVLGMLAMLASCLRAGEFKCAADTDCDRGGVQGICQDVGYCSFADSTCASGQRFTDLSGSLSNSCVEGSGFSVGGSIDGLTGELTLDVNGGDPLTTTTNGPFQFASSLVDGASYLVRVRAQPVAQTCLIANDSGTISGASVGDVDVSCGGVSSEQVLCSASDSCAVGTEVCCFDPTAGSGVCQTGVQQCGQKIVSCDAADDCAAGNVCCASYGGGNTLKGASCKSEAACVATMGTTVEIWCDPADGAAACPAGKACTGTPRITTPGYHVCM